MNQLQLVKYINILKYLKFKITIIVNMNDKKYKINIVYFKPKLLILVNNAAATPPIIGIKDKKNAYFRVLIF